MLSAFGDRDPAAIKTHTRAAALRRPVTHREERAARRRRGAGRHQHHPDRRIVGRQLIDHLGDQIEHQGGLIGDLLRKEDLQPARPARDQIGEIMHRRVGGREHQRARAEDLGRIPLRLEPAIALRAVALHHGADVGIGADQAVGQQKIEVGGLPTRRHRAAEQPLVDEGAYHRLGAGAVRRHHDVEQNARRTSAGR